MVDLFLARPTLSVLVVALVLVCGLSLCAMQEGSVSRAHLESVRADAVGDLAGIRSETEIALGKRLQVTLALKSYVSINPDLDEREFADLAALLIENADGVRSATLIKDNVINDVYPREGNTGAIGLNLLEHPEQRFAARRAIETGLPWLSGPIDLKQGGRAFIHRAPVHRTPPGGPPESGEYWGMVSILIDQQTLDREIKRAVPPGLRVAVQGCDYRGEPGNYFIDDASIKELGPITSDVVLPTGLWRLYAVPEEGWPDAAPDRGTRLFIGVGSSLLASILVFALVQSLLIYRASSNELASAHKEQQQTVADLKQSQRQLQITQDAVDHASVAIFFVRRDGTFAYANRQAERYLGYSRQELMQLSVSDINSQLTQDAWPEKWRSIRDNDRIAFEARHTRKDGTEMECRVEPWYVNFDGEELIVASVQDLSREKRANELRNVLFEKSTDAHLIFDDTGIIECNQAAVEMLAMDSKEELLLQHPAVFSPELQPDGQRSMDKRKEMDAIAQRRGFHRFDWMHRRKGGENFPCEVTLNPVQLESGPALLVVWHDISERKKLEEVLTESNTELQQFAYIASHDLQSPLRGIGGLAQIMLEEYRGQLDDQADEYLDMIVTSVNRMRDLIQDLLELSRVDSRSRPFEAVSLNEVFSDAMSLLQSSIDDAGATVTSTDLPQVQGDRSQLSQLLQNLIGNGIKYHDDQPPRVVVSAARDQKDWVITIRDNGIGIAPQHHSRIFDIFRRLHTDREYPGTGIGLAVCRRIVRRHGGDIWVESDKGAGSAFMFRLPAT